MTCTIIVSGHRETTTTYTRQWQWKKDPGRGFSFDCDQHGNLAIPEYQEGRDNLAFCLADNGKELIDQGVIKRTWSFYVDPVAECECGATFTLFADGLGENECPGCGSWYNSFGQSIVGPTHPWSGYNEDGEWFDSDY